MNGTVQSGESTKESQVIYFNMKFFLLASIVFVYVSLAVAQKETRELDTKSDNVSPKESLMSKVCMILKTKFSSYIFKSHLIFDKLLVRSVNELELS